MGARAVRKARADILAALVKREVAVGRSSSCDVVVASKNNLSWLTTRLINGHADAVCQCPECTSSSRARIAAAPRSPTPRRSGHLLAPCDVLEPRFSCRRARRRRSRFRTGTRGRTRNVRRSLLSSGTEETLTRDRIYLQFLCLLREVQEAGQAISRWVVGLVLFFSRLLNRLPTGPNGLGVLHHPHRTRQGQFFRCPTRNQHRNLGKSRCQGARQAGHRIERR